MHISRRFQPNLDHVPKLRLDNLRYLTMTDIEYTCDGLLRYSVVQSCGAGSLRASDTLLGTDFMQVGLPPDQGMIEVIDWLAVSMARLQQMILSVATGPAHIYESTTFVHTDNDLCNRQMIQSPSGYISFSVLDISIIMILSSLHILIAVVLSIIMSFSMQKWHWKDHKRVQWAHDENLQLLRLAHEGAGQGT